MHPVSLIPGAAHTLATFRVKGAARAFIIRFAVLGVHYASGTLGPQPYTLDPKNSVTTYSGPYILRFTKRQHDTLQQIGSSPPRTIIKSFRFVPS